MHNWVETAEIVSSVAGILSLVLTSVQFVTNSERAKKSAGLAMLGIVGLIVVVFLRVASQNQRLSVEAYDGSVRPQVLTDTASPEPSPQFTPRPSVPQNAALGPEQGPASTNDSITEQRAAAATPPTLNHPPTFAQVEVIPTSPKVGEPVDFAVHLQGGVGCYSCNWTGSTFRGHRIDNRESWTANVPKPRVIYKTPGLKEVKLTVYSYGSPFIAVRIVNVMP